MKPPQLNTGMLITISRAGESDVCFGLVEQGNRSWFQSDSYLGLRFKQVFVPLDFESDQIFPPEVKMR